MDDVNSLVTPNANRRDHTQHGFFFEVKAEFLNKETWEEWPIHCLYWPIHCLYWLPNRKKGNDRSHTQTLAFLGLKYSCPPTINGSFSTMKNPDPITYDMPLDAPV